MTKEIKIEKDRKFYREWEWKDIIISIDKDSHWGDSTSLMLREKNGSKGFVIYGYNIPWMYRYDTILKEKGSIDEGHMKEDLVEILKEIINFIEQ